MPQIRCPHCNQRIQDKNLEKHKQNNKRCIFARATCDQLFINDDSPSDYATIVENPQKDHTPRVLQLSSTSEHQS